MNASLIYLKSQYESVVLLIRRVLCLCALLCAPAGIAQEHAEPWAVLDSFPAEIDVVAVLENPAQQLLSESGQRSRKLLGSTGMFGKSHRAWATLGELFETDGDGVIGTLLSGRVVVLVDSLFEQSGNPLGLISSADTNWVVMAEVDAADLKGLRKKLKPVPREIVNGVAVYGLESGRYWFVMLRGEDGESSRVMLSPKGGRALLERALQAALKGGELHEDAVIPRWDGGGDWSVALRVRVGGAGGLMGERWDGAGQHLRAFVGGNDAEGLEISLALPIEGEIPRGRAPLGLLGALDGDIVMAMAASPVMRLVFGEDGSFSVRLRDSFSPDGTVLEPDGSLFVVSADDTGSLGRNSGPMGMTVMSIFGKGEVDAASIDELIEPLVFDKVAARSRFPGSRSSGQRSYGGMFPEAVRSHTVGSEQIETNVSWLTTQRAGSSEFVLSLSGEGVDTRSRVRMLSDAADSLDAVGMGWLDDEPAASSVVMSGFIRVQALLDSMKDIQWLGNMDSITGFERISWEVVDDEGALRGTVLVEKGLE